jgi:monovalent cation:H+ antiporter-2, CPA2 family
VESSALDIAGIFVELGIIILLLAMLARFAVRIEFSPIPLYLIAGLIFGGGGLLPLAFPAEFVQIGAEIGVILLLFMLGLAYNANELTASLRTALPFGVLNLLTSFPVGLVGGLLLGWEPLAAVLLGGVTYVSSSGIIAKLLNDLDWLGNRETPTVLSVLVLEDLTMAVYLPIVVVLLVGESLLAGAISLATAITTVVIVLIVVIRFGARISDQLASPSDEVVLLTTLSLILLVAGIAQSLQVSSAVGAFLVGIALEGPVAERARVLLTPLRDLFAATFFLFFGLQIDPATLPPVLGAAALLAVASTLSKFITGWVAASRSGIALRGRFRAGAILVPRGEFSIVIAGLGAGLGEPDLVPLAAAYVLIMAIWGPVLAKFIDPTVARYQRWRRGRRRTIQSKRGHPQAPPS